MNKGFNRRDFLTLVGTTLGCAACNVGQESDNLSTFVDVGGENNICEKEIELVCDNTSDYVETIVSCDDKCEKIDKLIVETEKAFAEFETLAMPYIEQVQDPELKKLLKIPFEVMKGNFDNPEKNEFRTEQVEKKQKYFGEVNEREEFSVNETQKSENPRWFTYKFMSQKDVDSRFKASINSHYEVSIVPTINLNPNFYAQSLGNMITLYHELYHFYYDRIHLLGEDEDRTSAQMMMKNYNSEGGDGRFLENEVIAKVIQIELLNLLSNGELEEFGNRKGDFSSDTLQDNSYPFYVLTPELIYIILFGYRYFNGGGWKELKHLTGGSSFEAYIAKAIKCTGSQPLSTNKGRLFDFYTGKEIK